MVCTNETSGHGALPILNLTAEEDAALYILRDGTGRRMLAVLYATLAVGVPGNLAFLLVVFRVPYMRTTTNVFLSGLALFDLMLLLSGVVSYSFYFGQPVRNHLSTAAAVGCLGAFMPHYFTYFASLFMLSLVSLDRYAAVCSAQLRPASRARAEAGIRRSVGLVLAGSAAAVALAGLVTLRYAKLTRYCAVWPAGEPYANLTVHLGYCQATGRPGLIVGHLLESGVFAVALLVNGAAYGSIVAYLSRRVRRGPERRPADGAMAGAVAGGRGSVSAQRALHVRNQVAVMLATNGAVFFLCQAPFVVVSLCVLADQLSGVPGMESHRRWAGPTTVCHAFLYLNSAVNPIIYNVASRHYRHAFAEAFSWSRGRRAVRAVHADDKNVLETLSRK